MSGFLKRGLSARREVEIDFEEESEPEPEKKKKKVRFQPKAELLSYYEPADPGNEICLSSSHSTSLPTE